MPNKLESDILEVLLEKIKEKKVVLWIGSGFSKYAGYCEETQNYVGYFTGTVLKDHLLKILFPNEIEKHHCDSLIKLADYYVQKNDRTQLIRELKKIYFDTPPKSLKHHNKLFNYNLFNHIITTNYGG